MNFLLPTLLIEDKNAIRNNSHLLLSLGKSCLIVTGKSSARKCGALEDIVEALEEKVISYMIFDEIEENPSVDTILRARDFTINKSIDFVIGIGGGSPMDAAKAIALMLKHPDYDATSLYNKDLDSKALPVVAVPTTCGTGSEVTGVSVLTRADRGTKGSIPHKIYPTLAFVDYRYIMALPKNILNNTAVDAFMHAVESLINTKSSEYSSMFAQEALRFLGVVLPHLLDENDALSDKNNTALDETDLRYLMHAASLAGMAIAHTGTSLPHALSYRLTYDDKIPHGLACGYFFKPFFRQTDISIKMQIFDCMNLDSEDQIYNLIDGLLDYSTIKKETVAKSIAEICANPAKLATAPFEANFSNYI